MSNDQSFGSQSGISDQAQLMLANFWPGVIENIKNLSANDYKTQELPLARIKKIMKLDEDVKMISAEAPVLFAKAAEIFVSELSLRAWIHTEDNKRRTLQRNDIAMAISKFDQFDFLIDIVPREELKPSKRQDELGRGGGTLPEQIQYYLQLAQQQSQQAQQTQVQQQTQQQTQVQVTQAASALQQIQHTPVQQATVTANAQNTAVQLPGGQIIQQQFQLQSPQQQVIQLPQVQQVVSPIQSTVIHQLQQQQHTQQLQSQAQAQQQQPTTQVYQQVVTASGQVESIPIQLTPQQLQSLQLQLQNKIAGHQIVVQTQQDPNVQFSQAQMYQLQQAGQQQIFIQSDDHTDGGADS